MYPQVWQAAFSGSSHQTQNVTVFTICWLLIWTIWKDYVAKRETSCCCLPVLHHDDVTRFPECSFLKWWLNHKLQDENKMQHTVFLDLPLMFLTERKMSDKWTVNLADKHKRSPTCISLRAKWLLGKKKRMDRQAAPPPLPSTTHHPLSSALEVSVLIGSWNSETYFNE